MRCARSSACISCPGFQYSSANIFYHSTNTGREEREERDERGEGKVSERRKRDTTRLAAVSVRPVPAAVMLNTATLHAGFPFTKCKNVIYLRVGREGSEKKRRKRKERQRREGERENSPEIP